MRNRFEILCVVACILFFSGRTMVLAQTNSWTNATSNYWEDSNWSLGVLPGTNQTILFTNSGWKALAIGPNTAENYPETMTVAGVIVSSPGTDTVNTLLLNYAGLQSPLQIASANDQGTFVLGTNCAVVMYSSALKIQNALQDGAFSIGGTFNESDGSEVDAGALKVGDRAPGVFNLTNSSVNAQWEYVGGGGFPATFNQQGGTNSGWIVMQPAGEYDLFDGSVTDVVELSGGIFKQFGGDVTVQLDIISGSYFLTGGTLSEVGSILPGAVPAGSEAWGNIVQSGGTNLAGGIQLADANGTLNYSLSGGTLEAASLDVACLEGVNGVYTSGFAQSGGYNTNGGVSIGGYIRNFTVEGSEYQLSDGILVTPWIGLDVGDFSQSGGTNEAGTISLDSVSRYDMSGGWLFAQSIQHNGGTILTLTGSFSQSGGTNQTSSLSLNNSSSYTLSGGQLVVGTIQIADSVFHCAPGSSAPGSLDGVKLLTLAGGTWDQKAGGEQHLGRFQLSGNTNSFFILPHAACGLSLSNSSSLVWSNAAVLLITNWSGSLYGGGNQQILFGNTASALTAKQVRQIEFQNPAGLAAGTYPARILATGEIVPHTGAALPLKIGVSGRASNGAMALGVEGDIGQSYDIEVSTDLVNWVWWTNEFNSNGTISVSDWGATNFPQRFYRARVAP